MKTLPLLAMAALVPCAFASPLYFTLKGKVVLVPADQGGYAAAHGIKAGTPVTYIFEVDTALQGYSLFGTDKNVPSDSSPSETNHTNYFFDSLITPAVFAGAFTSDGSGSFSGYHSSISLGQSSINNVVFQYESGYPEHGTTVVVYIPDTSATDFLPKVGAVLSATEDYGDSSVATSSVSMSLTVTAISTTRPSALRPAAPTAQPWLQATNDGNTLILRNGSGEIAEAALLTAAGKSALRFNLGETARLPLAGLPHGLFILRVAAPAAGGLAVTQTFMR